MSARIITDEITGARIVEVRCDKCGKHAPSAAEILAAHGLQRMGWACSGGTHVCEDCVSGESGA